MACVASNVYPLASTFCIHSNMGIEVAARLKCVSKSFDEVVGGYWNMIVDNNFHRICGSVYPLLSELGIWPTEIDTSMKMELTRVMTTNVDNRRELFRNVLDLLQRFESYEQYCLVTSLLDLLDPTDAGIFLAKNMQFFMKLTESKDQFYTLFYIINMTTNTMDKCMQMDLSNIHKVPCYFDGKLSRTILAKTEYLLHYKFHHSDPDAFAKDIKGKIDIIRNWMRFVNENIKIDKDLYRIYRGPRGGKHKIIDGQKVYMRR